MYRTREQQINDLEQRWFGDARWRGIERTYSAEDVARLRGTLPMQHTLAKAGAERLWELLSREPYVATFGALTGAQAVHMVRAASRPST
jgi:isocitrate lyase